MTKFQRILTEAPPLVPPSKKHNSPARIATRRYALPPLPGPLQKTNKYHVVPDQLSPEEHTKDQFILDLANRIVMHGLDPVEEAKKFNVMYSVYRPTSSHENTFTQLRKAIYVLDVNRQFVDFCLKLYIQYERDWVMAHRPGCIPPMVKKPEPIPMRTGAQIYQINSVKTKGEARPVIRLTPVIREHIGPNAAAAYANATSASANVGSYTVSASANVGVSSASVVSSEPVKPHESTANCSHAAYLHVPYAPPALPEPIKPTSSTPLPGLDFVPDYWEGRVNRVIRESAAESIGPDLFADPCDRATTTEGRVLAGHYSAYNTERDNAEYLARYRFDKEQIMDMLFGCP